MDKDRMSRVQILANFEIKDHELIHLELTSKLWQNYYPTIKNCALHASYEQNQPDGYYQIYTHDATDGVPFAYYWKKKE